MAEIPTGNSSGAFRPAEAEGVVREDTITLGTLGAASPGDVLDARIAAVMAAARYHGLELDRADLRIPSSEAIPSPATLAAWATDQGLWARGARLRWKRLLKVETSAPIVLFFNDGSAGLLVGADPSRNVVWIKDPQAVGSDAPVAVDELRLSQVWSGDVLLLRRARGEALEDQPFNLMWLVRLVFGEKRALRDVTLASLILSVIAIAPPLMTMQVIDRVVAHNSFPSLYLLATLLAILIFYETLLSYARREIIQVLGTRIDARLNLHVFNRLLMLPIEYFERHTTGEVHHRVAQVFRIRDFLTGKLMTTVLDGMTLFVLLPIVFYMEPTLAWIVLACAILIALIILAFLPAMRRAYGRSVVAEIKKHSMLVEAVHGVRTIKSLALENSRKSMWDERVAEAGHARLASGRLANWPQTLVTPLDSFIQRGVLMVGAYLALVGTSGVQIGGLVAFMMLGGRMAAPLVGIARLLEDVEEVRVAIGQVGLILNQPTEAKAMQGGLRPRFQGGVTFQGVTFTYPGSKTPALNDITFEVPPGTMLGLVGRSGSGKSTITRLLQGINREYTGYLKIDGADLREINLTHLRRSFGVVLQENFLFRGTVKDNILAGRPGLTLDDAIRAARLAGAEEFIERLPAGYETWIEEGSANLSGGQRQRLAIARALVSDPRLLILDEATSALDPESEALVNANLLRIGKGRTMFIVSHRLSSLVDCDQILVLDKGRLMDIGPHKTLLERCAIYRQLWHQQNRHVEGGGRAGTLKPVLAEGD